MLRSRAGACVCSEASSRRAASETSSTASSNAASLACDGLLKPDSLRTNCSAEAWISSSLAGGSKLNNVLMLRHIIFLLCRDGTKSLSRPQGRLGHANCYIAAHFVIEWARRLPLLFDAFS